MSVLEKAGFYQNHFLFLIFTCWHLTAENVPDFPFAILVMCWSYSPISLQNLTNKIQMMRCSFYIYVKLASYAIQIFNVI